MRYIRCTLELDPIQPATDIFVATLAELGFESFEETETGVMAYIQESQWDEGAFTSLPLLKSPEWEAAYTLEVIEPENWNAVWEQDYKPIQVRDLCMVRAPFHQAPSEQWPYDIVITPKMSFGTGHHQTTYLMLDYLLDLELSGKSVLDVGTGTGVLAILAGMRGASPITAIDIDPWAFENCLENTRTNGLQEIEVLQGDMDIVEGRSFDVVLANINKNVLLAHLPSYAKAINSNGVLLLSGYFAEDLEELRGVAVSNGFKYSNFREKDGWVAALFSVEIP